MRIIILCRLYDPHIGGVEKHVKNVSSILSKKHFIKIITEQYSEKLPEYEKRPEAEIYRIPLKNSSEKAKKWVIWRWFLQHKNLIADCDIVHVHDVYFWILPLRFLYQSKRYFITFHGYVSSTGSFTKQIIWHKIGELLTSGNICIGDFQKKWFKAKPTVVSYGAVRPSIKIYKKTGRAVFFSRLAPDTGIMEYLAAISKLELEIDIFGDGPLRVKAEEYCKLNNISAEYYGFRGKVNEILSKYSLAFTSQYLGIQEALVSKVPVISYYESPLKHDYLEMAPFAKYIQICGSTEEIINAYKNIIDHPLATKEKLDTGYNWVCKQTWKNLSHLYDTLWQKNINIQTSM